MGLRLERAALLDLLAAGFSDTLAEGLSAGFSAGFSAALGDSFAVA